MKTIGFFGDSFCASDRRTSWCRILSNKVNRRPIHYGKPGGSIWNVFMTIEMLLEQGTLPDTIFICYTDPYRLYHKSLALQLGNSSEQTKKTKNASIYDAADRYYVYVQDKKKEDLAYKYSLNWFDKKVLKKLEPRHEIIQTWSLDPKAMSVTKMNIELTTGLYLDQSIHEFAYKHVGGGPDLVFDPSWENHLTKDGNQEFAYYIYDKIKNFLE